LSLTNRKQSIVAQNIAMDKVAQFTANATEKPGQGFSAKSGQGGKKRRDDKLLAPSLKRGTSNSHQPSTKL